MPSYWPQLLRMKGHRYRKEFCISALPLVSPELGVISAEARVGILERGAHEPRLGGDQTQSRGQITFATHTKHSAA